MLIKTITASSAVIAAALAVSQAPAQQLNAQNQPEATEASLPVESPMQPATTATPSNLPMKGQAPVADISEAAKTMPANGASSPQNDQVVAFVNQQFPTVDSDQDGSLTQGEFEHWISTLKTDELQSAGKPVNMAEVKTYAESAFLSADKDRDLKITKGEITQFFSQS